MSVGSAALPGAGRLRYLAAAAPVEARERPGVRLVTFAALGLYGVLRWAALMSSPPTGRLLALLALAIVLGALGAILRGPARALVAFAAVLAVLAAFAFSGVPLAWVVHLRVALAARAIGDGLSALPRVLVPYSGASDWVRMVIVMGAAVLVLDAGLLLAFAPARLGDARRAAIALPLIALAVVPSTLLRPKHPYLHGLLLFVLIAAFMWAERVRRRELAWALAAGLAAAIVAMLVSPSLDRHKPWLNYQSLTAGLAQAHADTFDWSQRYGPLNWPQTGRAVLEVQAARGDYWKAEDLDTFNGFGWMTGGGSLADPRFGASRAALARWTQTITVTLRAMSTSTVIASGAADPPRGLGSSVGHGAGSGTWVSSGVLGPGDSYRVSTYTPRPTAAELAGAGEDYPGGMLYPYRSIDLPPTFGQETTFPVTFPPFHSGASVQAAVMIGGQRGADLVGASPYGRTYALAKRLAGSSRTPYAFVNAVERYLSRGFTYDQSPPSSRYPLVSFLFGNHLGYCQQFAGAMALLLRMGGLPARVAAGFTSGTYDRSTKRWVVSDLDAHAWVEVWFPHFGWVGFDPTPAAATARGGNGVSPSPDAIAAAARSLAAQQALRRETPVSPGSGIHGQGGGGLPIAVIVGLALAGLLVLGVGGRALSRRHPAAGEELLAELERALRRTGRPLEPGVTLAALEHRFRGAPEAAGYIRAIRLARFRGHAEPPSPAQRRALRAELRAGLGFGAAALGLWALPPRRAARKKASPGNSGA